MSQVSSLQKKLEDALRERQSLGSCRNLIIPNPELVDFYSSNYLGLAASEDLSERVQKSLSKERSEKAARVNGRLNGSAGSRLIAGNSLLAEQVEKFLANYYKSPSYLLFKSGYDAKYLLND